MYQASKLQSAQNSLNSNVFRVYVGANGQDWFSFDILNTQALEAMVDNQFNAGTQNRNIRDFRMLMKGFKLKVTIANQIDANQTSPAILDMYFLVPRFDIDWDEFSRYVGNNGNILARYFKEGASGVLPTGELQPNFQGDSIPDFGKIGFTPFMYQAFCRMFKVVKIKTIKLPIGETYISDFSVRSKYINPSRFLTKLAPSGAQQARRSKMYLKGISSTVLCRVRGTPGFQEEPGTSISRPVNLSVVWEEQCTCKVMQTRPGSVSQDINA